MQVSTKTFHVSIPNLLSTALDKRVTEKFCASRSQYMQDLIRADLVRGEQEKLERMLLEGIASGSPIHMDSSERAKLKKEVIAQAKKH